MWNDGSILVSFHDSPFAYHERLVWKPSMMSDHVLFSGGEYPHVNLFVGRKNLLGVIFTGFAQMMEVLEKLPEETRKAFIMLMEEFEKGST